MNVFSRICFEHWKIWYSILFRVSSFDLPAHASLSRVLQPPQEVRQEQIDAIMQIGLWQAGIRIFTWTGVFVQALNSNILYRKMNKKAYKDYLNRWKLVAEIEKREIKTTTFELLLRQTISIWDISKSLQFSDKSNSFDSLWVHLQKKWIDRHAWKWPKQHPLARS